MRGLHQRHLRVLEIADERVQGIGKRHVVGVEHEHELALGERQRVVDVAGLRMGFVGAGHVARAPPLGQFARSPDGAVVQ